MKNNIRITFFGGLISAAVAFLLNIVAARILEPSEFQSYSVYFNLTLIISAVFEFGLPSSLVVIFNKKGYKTVEEITSSIIYISFFCFVIMAFILFFLDYEYIYC